MLATIVNTVTGLPTHILVVHAVVVLIPLCFLGVCIAARSSTWRQRLALPIIVLFTIGWLACVVAAFSGRSLKHRIGTTPAITHHGRLGVIAVFVVFLALVITVGWLLGEHMSGSITLRPEGKAQPAQGVRVPSAKMRTAAMVLAVVSCAFATGWIAYTGDAGSRAIWKPIMQSTK
jgi:hypothetical protein